MTFSNYSSGKSIAGNQSNYLLLEDFVFWDLHLELTDMPRLQKLSIYFDEDTEIERDIDLLNSSQLRSLDLSGARSDLWRVIMGTVQTQ